MLAFVEGVAVGADMMEYLFYWGDAHWGFVLPLLLILFFGPIVWLAVWALKNRRFNKPDVPRGGRANRGKRPN